MSFFAAIYCSMLPAVPVPLYIWYVIFISLPLRPVTTGLHSSFHMVLPVAGSTDTLVVLASMKLLTATTLLEGDRLSSVSVVFGSIFM